MCGGTPISGSARASAAKVDTTKNTSWTQARGCTTAWYHGSKVAKSASTRSTPTNTMFVESSVALA